MNDTLATTVPGGMDDRFLRRAYRVAGGISLAGAGTLSGAGWGVAALNFGIGAGLSVLAVLSLDILVRRYVVPGTASGRNRRALSALAFAKLPVIMGIFYGLVRMSWFQPVWLTIGLGVMPVVIITCAIAGALMTNR